MSKPYACLSRSDGGCDVYYRATWEAHLGGYIGSVVKGGSYRNGWMIQGSPWHYRTRAEACDELVRQHQRVRKRELAHIKRMLSR